MDGEGSNTSWNTKSSLLSDLSLDLEELELQPLIANNNTSLDLTETLDFDIGDILELSAAEIPTEQKTWYNDQSNYCPDAKQEINFFVDSTQHSTHNRLQHVNYDIYSDGANQPHISDSSGRSFREMPRPICSAGTTGGRPLEMQEEYSITRHVAMDYNGDHQIGRDLSSRTWNDVSGALTYGSAFAPSCDGMLAASPQATLQRDDMHSPELALLTFDQDHTPNIWSSGRLTPDSLSSSSRVTRSSTRTARGGTNPGPSTTQTNLLTSSPKGAKPKRRTPACYAEYHVENSNSRSPSTSTASDNLSVSSSSSDDETNNSLFVDEKRKQKNRKRKPNQYYDDLTGEQKNRRKQVKNNRRCREHRHRLREKTSLLAALIETEQNSKISKINDVISLTEKKKKLMELIAFINVCDSNQVRELMTMFRQGRRHEMWTIVQQNVDQEQLNEMTDTLNIMNFRNKRE